MRSHNNLTTIKHKLQWLQRNSIFLYLHNHSIGAFADILQISVSGPHFEHLAPNDLRVGITARGTCSLSHRDAGGSHLTNGNNTEFSINSLHTADTRLPIL